MTVPRLALCKSCALNTHFSPSTSVASSGLFLSVGCAHALRSTLFASQKLRRVECVLRILHKMDMPFAMLNIYYVYFVARVPQVSYNRYRHSIERYSGFHKAQWHANRGARQNNMKIGSHRICHLFFCIWNKAQTFCDGNRIKLSHLYLRIFPFLEMCDRRPLAIDGRISDRAWCTDVEANLFMNY